MTYLEKIMQKQKLLALQLDGQVAELPEKVSVGILPKKSGDEDTSVTAAAEAQSVETDGAALLLEKFSEVQSVSEKIAAIRQQSILLRERIQQEQSVERTTIRMPDSVDGGLIARGVAPLQSTGVAGYDTVRSMAEISRFFERDSRRYGGDGW